MIKKFISYLMLVFMILALVGCAGKKSADQDTPILDDNKGSVSEIAGDALKEADSEMPGIDTVEEDLDEFEFDELDGLDNLDW